jgi:ABC-type dipeptide/oligopeptide/nickel transport system ATPase subunit
MHSEKAREIIQLVAQATMSNLEFHISNLVSLALKSVSPDFPEFVAKIEIRRNQTEVDFLFSEFGREQKPMDSSGYGAVNIGAYALRVSFWSLDKNRNVMLLDEPFPDLSPDLQEKAGDMVKMISEKLNLQHILISHAEDFNYGADRTFTITKHGDRSKISIN